MVLPGATLSYAVWTMAARGRQPNDLLRRARGSRTQAELAELVNAEIYHRTGSMGSLTAKAISDLECGWYRWPVKTTRDALCVVLDASQPSDLGFTRTERHLVRPALSWSPPDEAVTLDGRPANLAAIRAVSMSLQPADRQLGGGHLYPAVVGYLRSEITPQLTSAIADHDGADLFAAAASFSEIAGWMSHDGGHDHRAERHFAQAIRLARASEQVGVTGNIQASMSHLAVQLGRHKNAVQLADDGIRSIQRERSHRHLLARLHAMRARGLAAADGQTCRAALACAERTLDQAGTGASEEWVSHFDVAALASEIAWCLHRLNDLSAARRYAENAIDLRSSDRVRSRSFAQLGLAEILVAIGDVEHAATLGTQVRAAATTLTSARVRAQLVGLAGSLEPHVKTPAVADFLATMKAITAAPTLIEEPS